MLGKRGHCDVVNSESVVESTAPEQQQRLFAALPNDIGSLILGYLPAYMQSGRNSVAGVSHAWHKALRRKPTVKEVVASCKSATDALNILADEYYWDQLSKDQTLTVAAWHPELASDLQWREILTVDELLRLNHRTPSKYVEILKANRRAHLETFFENHPDVTEYLCATSGLKKILTERNIKVLQRYATKEKALKLLGSEASYNKLDTDTLFALAMRHECAAEIILSNDALSSKLEGMLHWFVNKHTKIINTFLKYRKEILSLTYLKSFVTDASTSIAIYDYINQHGITCTIKDLVQVVRFDPTLAEKIFNQHKSALDSADLYLLAHQNEKIGLEIMENQELREKCFLCSHMVCRSFADAKVKHPSIVNKILFYGNLKELADLARTNPETADLAFEKAKDYVLDSDSLLSFGLRSEKVATTILQSKHFIEKLTPSHRWQLVVKFPKLLHMVCTTPEISAYFPNHEIFEIRNCAPRNVLPILNHPVVKKVIFFRPSLRPGLDSLPRCLLIAKKMYDLANQLRTGNACNTQEVTMKEHNECKESKYRRTSS